MGTVVSRAATVIEEVPPLLYRDKFGNPVSLQGYRRVRDETGHVHIFLNSSINRTDARLGQTGRVVKVESPTMSLWRFVAHTDNEEV